MQIKCVGDVSKAILESCVVVFIMYLFNRPWTHQPVGICSLVIHCSESTDLWSDHGTEDLLSTSAAGWHRLICSRRSRRTSVLFLVKIRMMHQFYISRSRLTQSYSLCCKLSNAVPQQSQNNWAEQVSEEKEKPIETRKAASVVWNYFGYRKSNVHQNTRYQN